GLHGVRDINLLGSIIERPKMAMGGKDLYLDIFEKAAVYFESCACHHVFIDGNKRTAIALAARFLHINGYILKTSNEILENFVSDAVVKKYDIAKIAVWLKKHSKNNE
ncbi:MAG: type II toxin-antitoxin system death-on-curing family toxin, partial [Patescibacteria group bacterium]